MAVIKYKNQKRGGMPVHFPIGCRSKAAITGHRVANPFLDGLTQTEADELVELDPHNFEHADAAEYAEHKRAHGLGSRGEPSGVESLTDEELETVLAARKAAKAGRKAKPEPKPKPVENPKPARAQRKARPAPKAKAEEEATEEAPAEGQA